MFDIKMESIPDAPMAPGQWKSSGAASNLAERLTALGQTTHTELRDEWRRLFRAHPPKKISRDLLTDQTIGSPRKRRSRSSQPYSY